MKTRGRFVLLLLCFALSFVACDTGEGSPADDGGDTSTDSDAGTDATTSDASDAGDAEPAVDNFQIGTNPVAESTPDRFVPMSDGAEVPLVWGVQGSWMVVLAFRTRDLFEGTFDVVAEITIDGVESGDIWLEAQETFPGGNGWDYYYNLFLPIDVIDPPPRGTPAHILMRVTDEDGTTAEREHDVLIGPADGP